MNEFADVDLSILLIDCCGIGIDVYKKQLSQVVKM